MLHLNFVLINLIKYNKKKKIQKWHNLFLKNLQSKVNTYFFLIILTFFPVILPSDIVNKLSLILKFICLCDSKRNMTLPMGLTSILMIMSVLTFKTGVILYIQGFIVWNKERLLVFSTDEKDQQYTTEWHLSCRKQTLFEIVE